MKKDDFKIPFAYMRAQEKLTQYLYNECMGEMDEALGDDYIPNDVAIEVIWAAIVSLEHAEGGFIKGLKKRLKQWEKKEKGT